MRKRLQLAVLGLGLATAFPAPAQTGIFANTAINPARFVSPPITTPSVLVPRLTVPGTPALADATRRGDPVVVWDRVVIGPTNETLVHLSVYADGLVTVSRALFFTPGTTVEQADFVRVELEEVEQLRRDLDAAGATRLNGLLRGSGFLPTFAVTSHVTYFARNRSLRPRLMTANHFSFGADVLDARAVAVEDVLEAFIQNL
jgi:hypothetical protein